MSTGVAPPRAGPRAVQSSRRKGGSTAPRVVLGGGAGVLGQPTIAARKGSPRSPRFPVHFESSPREPTFDSASQTSLATTASTSSRTLKTPHSKQLDSSPLIATASPQDSPLMTRNKSPLPVSPTPRRSSGPNTLTSQPLPAPPRKPAPLTLTNSNRLSQDWVQVPATRRLPQPEMIPVKAGSPSPRRPSFDRANTEPVSPTRARPQRTRQSSYSTPPTMIERPAPRMSADALTRPVIPDQRKSSDVLTRPSMDAARKEKKGISLKKSSGALRALFKKGKDKEPVPEMPERPPTRQERAVTPRPSTPPKPEQTPPTPPKIAPETPPKRAVTPRLPPAPTLAHSDTETSLAYMNRTSVMTRNSVMYDYGDEPGYGMFDPLPTVKSLHLLSLPDLDLDLDVSFDRFGSPTTPRRSPRRSPPRSPRSPRSPLSPQRSQSTRSPPALRAERRRSQSFDGLWREEDLTKFFSNTQSSSAPLLSKALEPAINFSTRSESESASSESPQTPPDATFSPGPPPPIPLPAPPMNKAKEPEPVIDEVLPTPREPPALVKPAAPARRVRTLAARSQVVSTEGLLAPRQLARELDNMLHHYRYPAQHMTGVERANMLRVDLVGMLSEIDKQTFDEDTGAVLRRVCFEWAETLLNDMRVEQPAHERGACLDGLAAVLENECLSERALKRAPTHAKMFTSLMARCMGFVMGKLGAKGVFHNTLLFSGRFLAFAFFRIPHVAEQLVTVLQPKRGALMRFTRPILVGAPTLPDSARPRYPAHLLALCFDDSRSYTARLSKLVPTFETEEERAAFLFQSGNWLRRWQSDDSELFPAFYRAYHRQLAQYLVPAIEHFESLDMPLPASVLLRAPGYAHLATVFATKCHSYILGSVNAVTTSSSSASFEAQETAGFRGSQKPAVLDTANRRLVETLTTFANLRVIVPSSRGMIEVDGPLVWSDVIDAWTRDLVGKTSLYAPKGVFSLFDLLDGIVDPPVDTQESLLDVPYLIHVVRIILTQGEHALTLVKAIAFVFTHWEALTARAEDRKELCLGLLLQKDVFERLLLFWSQSVRSYVLRLVVFRLGHLHTSASDGAGHQVEIESVRMLQIRLDGIKTRHDELEPRISEVDETEHLPTTPQSPRQGGLSRSRSTITMVHDSPATVSNKAERLLGLGFGMETKEDERVSLGVGVAGGKASTWLKKLGIKGRRSASPSPNLDASPRQSTPALPAPAPGFRSRSPANVLSSPMMSEGSPVESTRKAPPPPMILTSSPSSPPRGFTQKDATPRSPRSPSGFAFEFELPTASPRSDAFDLTPGSNPTSPRKSGSTPSSSPSPHPPAPASPHMSRSFSKRSSLLPPSTANALEGLLRGASVKREEKREKGYDKKSHAYAIRMLAELEDAQKEYDEWWSENGIGRMDGAPPRLAVAWPFHEGDD